MPAADLRARPGSMPPAWQRAIYYGLGVTEHSQGSTTVIGIANPPWPAAISGREGVGVNPLRGPEQRAGLLRHGQLPHELPGYRHVSDDHGARQFEPPGA